MTNPTVGSRERALFSQSLAPLVRGLEGQQVIVELKNDIVIFGKLTLVDCFMNLTMENVTMTKANGEKCLFEFFFLQRKNLRYVQIPNHIQIQKTLKEQLDIVTGAKAQEERRKAREKKSNYLRNKQLRKQAEEAKAVALFLQQKDEKSKRQLNLPEKSEGQPNLSEEN